MAVLTALSGKIEVPGACVSFYLLVLEFHSIIFAHGGHNIQLPAVESYATRLDTNQASTQICFKTFNHMTTEDVEHHTHLIVVLSGSDAFLCGFFSFKLSKGTAWESKREKGLLVTLIRYHF